VIVRGLVNYIKRLPVIVVLVGINACSSGSSGSSAGGVASIEAAKLADVNVDQLVTDLVSSVSMSFSAVIGRSLVNDTVQGTSYTAHDNACFVGVADVSYVLDANNRMTGQLTYVDYDDCHAVRLNGGVQLQGDFESASTIDRLSMRLDNVQVFRLTDGQSFTISGQMDLDWLPSFQGSAEYTLNLNLTITDVSNGNTYRFENFRLDSKLTASTNTTGLSGRFYHSVYGYVDISTISNLEYTDFNAQPGYGAIQLTAASQSVDVIYSNFSRTIIF